MARAGAPNYELIWEIANYFCEYPDRCHHPKENAIFQYLGANFPQEAEAIGDLGTAHVDTRERVTRFRQFIYEILQDSIIVRAAAVSTARSFIEAERRHMQMEEGHFFPVAEKTLAHEDWTRVGDVVGKERDPLFGGQVDEAFKRLSERLISWEAVQLSAHGVSATTSSG
jgi:hemerythrin-like domain-containing protein